MKRLFSLFICLLMIFPLAAGIIPVSAHNAENIEEVEAKYFDVKPVIDGYISEAEWGDATVWMLQSSDNPYMNPTTIGGTSPFPNRFFYNTSSYAEDYLNMEYYLWLRWDEDYFYIGAKVYDPDGHSLQNGRTNTWNGDALQVRIDPDGANAICYGDTFYPEDYPNDRDYNGNEIPGSGHKPWGSKAVCDLIFGYVQGAGGYKEAWNNTTNVNKSMILNSAYTQANGVVDMAVAPAGTSYSSDTSNGITTYEVAIPWKYIDYNRTNGHEYYKFSNLQKINPDGSIKQGPNGAIGYEYGMSAVVYNADGASGGNALNAGLGWGSGIITRQLWDDTYKTCAGSNAVILSGDKVSEDALYAAGYDTYTVGGTPSQLPPPNYDFEIDSYVHENLTYDDPSDMDIFGDVSNGERVQLDDGNWVVKWDLATERDDPNAETGELPTHNTYNYLSTDGYEENGADARYESYGNSFTFEFDVKVTDFEMFENGYGSAIYNWFGGTSYVNYQCGYFFDDGKFKIVNTNDPSEVVAEYECDFTINEWHHWVFQYDDASCTLRFYFDPEMDGDRVSSTAEPIFNIFYRYFDYGSIKKTILILRRMNVQMMLDNVQMYNFVDYTHEPIITPLFLPIYNNERYTSDNLKALSFIVRYDPTVIKSISIEDIDSDAYTLVNTAPGQLEMIINDFTVFKNTEVGEKVFSLKARLKYDVPIDEVGNYLIVKANITTSSVPIDPTGDVNGDGVVTISDVLYARKYLAGIIDSDRINANNADVSGDGKLTIADILLIRKYLAGIIPSLPYIK